MALKLTGAGKSIVFPVISGRDRIILLYNFDVDSERLKEEHRTILEEQVIYLLSQGGGTTLRGMSSKTGSERSNKELSLKRANRVKAYLTMAAPSAAHVYVSTGVGEKTSQINDIEDELYRSVLLVVSPDKVVRMLPEKPLYPPPPQHPNWQSGEFEIEVKTLDLLFYKKMLGALYLSYGPCSSYIAWDLSVSNLGLSVGIKGKPPIDIGDLRAFGTPFFYDLRLIDPWLSWRDKGVRLRFYGKTITVTIVDALPKKTSPAYRPFKGSGISINGRDVSFTMTSDSGVLGLVEGFGSIKKPREKRPPKNCRLPYA